LRREKRRFFNLFSPVRTKRRKYFKSNSSKYTARGREKRRNN
jgi:hypothetical protein